MIMLYQFTVSDLGHSELQANAAAFITAQESVLLELYPPAEEETDDGQTEPESTESEGSEPTDAPESEVE